MWQHKSKSHFITTKVADIDKCSLVAPKAALIFASFIVMPILASLNLIYIDATAVVADASNFPMLFALVSKLAFVKGCEH
jgi:hypothetical protein